VAKERVGRTTEGLPAFRNAAAIAAAREIATIDSSTARWVARDALRELTSSAKQDRLRAVGTPSRTSSVATR
jgi:hypothetical protein